MGRLLDGIRLWVRFLLAGTQHGCADGASARGRVHRRVAHVFLVNCSFGSICISVGQNVLNNHLAKRLAGILGTSPRLIQSTGATEPLNVIPTQYHTTALKTYDDGNDSLLVSGS